MRLNPALARASMAAQRVLARHVNAWDSPIDVFSIVQREGIWLASRPLDGGLFGFYLRTDQAAGIVVNSNHPETLQRYTCAHELGHHVLGHRSHLDDQHDVSGPLRRSNADELAAQVFAGNLLMPLQAVNRALRRHGVERREPSSAEVYLIARDMDVSYSAAVWQLVTLGRLSQTAAQAYVREGAAAAKRKLRPGASPTGDNRADLVLLDVRMHEQGILCRVGDEIRLRLTENPTTGFRWNVGGSDVTERPDVRAWLGGTDLFQTSPGTARAAALRGVALVSDSFDDRSELGEVGGSGIREFVLIATEPGATELRADLTRAWEPETPAQQFRADLRISPTHLLDGFARTQISAHTARVKGGVA